MKQGDIRPEHSAAIEALARELHNLDANAFPALHALAENELFRLRGGIADSLDIIENRKVKIRAKVNIPADQYPAVNFVGKLLGPGGQTLRAIQESTRTKMAILGAGSLRDDFKEKELLSNGDPKFQHLKQKLHLQVDSLAPPSEAYYRLSHALAEVRKIMILDMGELPPPPWIQPNQSPNSNPGPVPRGAGHMRGGRPPRIRGGFALQSPCLPTPMQTQATSPMFRGRGGRGQGWVPTPNIVSPVANTGVAMPPGTDCFGNGSDPYNYANTGGFIKPEYETTSYEDFGASYGQNDAWGKMGIADGRGRGRVHPYVRPGVDDSTQ